MNVCSLRRARGRRYRVDERMQDARHVEKRRGETRQTLSAGFRRPRPTFERRLTRARHGQLPLRRVFADHRPRADRRIRADGHRRYQRGVRADESAVFDRRGVFVGAVVVLAGAASLSGQIENLSEDGAANRAVLLFYGAWVASSTFGAVVARSLSSKSVT